MSRRVNERPGRRPPLGLWLRVQRLLRLMLTEPWNEEAWKQVKPEIKKALAQKSKIERAGWFN